REDLCGRVEGAPRRGGDVRRVASEEAQEGTARAGDRPAGRAVPLGAGLEHSEGASTAPSEASRRKDCAGKARARNGDYSDAQLAVSAAAGFADQRREQVARGGIARDELFGVPLHADDEAVGVRQLDGLAAPVGGPGDPREA